ncbi:O-antigen ligase family protein [Thiohalophilus thiocyanatoxydans]|uniref:O-antigen ligase n=1 Tax=Thiohalophilus thiocyanatoxydans TaxID=381308 RepID=A0A4R8IT95_9GAMM|nr:O-antigen ligase family protein [Thiohalophilus thiocyanatoxydans]TDY03838.1 O-antigen ligase [Thiohalophilus thiocyanatoxydans]
MTRLLSVVAESRATLLSILLFLTALIAALIFNGFYLQFYSIALLALFGWLLLALLQGYHRQHTVIVTPLALACGLFLGFLALSLLYHPVPYLGVMNLWWVGAFALIVLIRMLQPASESSWRPGFGLFILLAAGLALWGALEQLVYGSSPDASFYNQNSLAALINLALLPLAAVYLSAPPGRRRAGIVTGLLLFTFVLGIITSRGALLAFALATGLLFALAWRRVALRRLGALAGWLGGGFVLAWGYSQLSGIGGGKDMFSRMATLADPETSGNPRFVLWQPAWEMLQAQPFSGIGLGAFFLKLPSSARLEDKSAGYYVHNDYLQLATETGLPGLFFLLLIIGVLIGQFTRLIRHYRRSDSTDRDPSRPARGTHLEAVGLFAALLSLGIHSAFTYNFYVLPLMIVAGLYLARLDRLYARQTPAYCLRFHWKPHFQPLSFYLLSFAIVLAAGGYFVTLAVADHYHQRGAKLAAGGQIQQAHFAFERAQRLSPYMDSPFYMDADLLIRSAELLPEDNPKRSNLLDYAADKLDQAAELNPYQAHTPYLQGRLSALQDGDPDTAMIYYRQALKNNPRFLPARMALARHHRQQNRPDEAFAILKKGLDYPYHSLSRELLDYMQLTAQLAARNGEKALATRLQDRLEQFQEDYERQQQQGRRRPSQRY